MRDEVRSGQVTSRTDQVMSVSSAQFRLGKIMTRLGQVLQVRVDRVRRNHFR